MVEHRNVVTYIYIHTKEYIRYFTKVIKSIKIISLIHG
jgi:hypothetical protein